MKTVGFDLRPLQGGYKASKTRGIGVYTRNLIKRRNLIPEGLSPAAFHDPLYESEEAGEYGSAPYRLNAVEIFLKRRMGETASQYTLMRRVVERTARAAGAGLMFFPTHLDAPPGLSIPYAVTAHDMIQAVMMERFYGSRRSRAVLRKQIAALQGARLVIAVSEHTKGDVVRLAGVEHGRIAVIHNGVDEVFRPGAPPPGRFVLPERFILNVGGIDPRKNVDLLLGAFTGFAKQRPEYGLVMTGAMENDPEYPRFLRLVRELELEGKVFTLGYVTQGELAGLYGLADVFLYPSLYEGFGLPVLEAMACGAPVVAADRSSVPEVAGDAAILLDPNEPEAFTKALLTLADSEDGRKKLSRAGVERAAGFSWDTCAERTYEALASAL
ncbi:MAG: glycosyltransferase family 4 protein [Candidatus Nitrospinota bacterium M3_3B_026]